MTYLDILMHDRVGFSELVDMCESAERSGDGQDYRAATIQALCSDVADGVAIDDPRNVFHSVAKRRDQLIATEVY